VAGIDGSLRTTAQNRSPLPGDILPLVVFYLERRPDGLAAIVRGIEIVLVTLHNACASCASAMRRDSVSGRFARLDSEPLSSKTKKQTKENMKKLHLVIITALGLSAANLCFAQSDAPYDEGPVWTITMVKTKAGMTDDYLKMLAKIYKSTNEEAKKQGVIMDYKILLGDASNANDFEILLMQEFQNMAAFDGQREKLDPINKKIIGSADVQRQGAVKRMDVREIMGNKLMREITLK
jgi:hypothetical protein